MKLFRKKRLPEPSPPADPVRDLPVAQVSDEDFLDPSPELRAYVERALRAGLSRGEVERRVRGVGWPDTVTKPLVDALYGPPEQPQRPEREERPKDLLESVKEQLSLGYDEEMVRKSLVGRVGSPQAAEQLLSQAREDLERGAKGYAQSLRELRRYIQEKRAHGISDEQIRDALTSQGWDERTIQEELLL